MLTVALVVMVMFLFLRSVAATIIPSVAVPLSIVGTFGAMYLLGYSLDNLSLMALTISTGFVVDDAIVMIENISRYIEEGHPPLEAALKGSEQIGFTIVSLTFSLTAVLIPLLFMGDIVGRLFREFAVTLGVTIFVSAFVSLTLTPMMCAKLLHRVEESERSGFYRALGALLQANHRTVRKGLCSSSCGTRHATLLVTAGTLVLTLVLAYFVPKGFFPVQDTGRDTGCFGGPADRVLLGLWPQRQRALAQVILKDPDVVSLSSFIGVDGTNMTPNSGRIQINLKPRETKNVNSFRYHPPAPARTRAGRRNHALHAAGAGHYRRRSGEPDAVSVFD